MTVVAQRSNDDLTAEWLTSILREEGASVEKLMVEDIGVGRGFVCQTVRLTPTYAGAGSEAPATLVAKVPTFLGFSEDLMPLLATLVTAEPGWYRAEQPMFPGRAPRSFGSVYGSVTEHALLLEDLGGLREFTQVDGCSADEARLIVEHLGRAHAHWWETERLQGSDWLPSVEQGASQWEPYTQAGWELFAERIVPRIDPAFAAIRERVAERYGDLLRKGAASASTLVHGDFRLENLMMGERGSEDELVILDWQLIGWGSGLRDLAYFVGQNLAPEVRQEAEGELVELYDATLVANGVGGYELSRCKGDYRRGLLLALSVPIGGTPALADIEPPGGRCRRGERGELPADAGSGRGAGRGDGFAQHRGDRGRDGGRVGGGGVGRKRRLPRSWRARA